MKGLREYIFWIGIVVLGVLYVIFIDIKSYKEKRFLKLKIKSTKEIMADMKIVDKYLYKKNHLNIAKNILPSDIEHSYNVALEFEDKIYEVDDKKIFNSYEIGQFVKLELIKSFDENNKIVSYDLFRINN